ncbi:hypothetical protein [Methanolapillus africanus]
MTQRGKKSSISFTISQKLLNQLNSMTQSGKFTSISDVVSTSIVFLIAERTNLNFDDSTLIETVPEDNSVRPKISAALNEYLDTELENISKDTQKSKSYIVRVALYRFIEFYNNNEITKKQEVVPGDELLVQKTELKEMVRGIAHEVVPEIIDEYLKKINEI